MFTSLTHPLGRLRLLAFCEGLSLLLLVFVAVPAKHLFNSPALVQIMGPIHGLLFLLFIINALQTGTEQHWKFGTITWKVLLACIIPFGTFYIDYAILRKLKPNT